MSEIQGLSDKTTGRYLVTTASGSQIDIDLDLMLMRRVTHAEAGEDWTVANKLDGDGDSVIIHTQAPLAIEVGKCISLVTGPPLHGYRSTPVRKIEELTPDEPEIWSLTSTGPVLGEVRGAQIFTNVHPASKCTGRHCVLHNPSDHHMREWPTMFRADLHFMERTCEHGVGHPDPDDVAWHKSQGRAWVSVHGCDGCCRP